MKKLFVLVFMVIAILSNGQSVCTSTEVPTKIYYPNSITTNSTGTFCEYLCGPNTIVYDTLTYACTIYVSSNCTLTLKPLGNCPFPISVYLKSNSTLNFIAGTGPDSYGVIMEPGALIDNPSGAVVYTSTCSAISFPTVNCASAGLNEKAANNELLNIFPNPANDQLNIKWEYSYEGEVFNVGIYNSFGKLVKEKEMSFKDGKGILDTKQLPNGVYLLSISSTNFSSKTNSKGLAVKRFIITR